MKSYLAVLGSPGAWRFLAPAFLARLPYAMLQLGVLLLVHWSTGSYGAAGIASAAAAVTQALVGPQTGRLADRYGQAKVLLPQVAVHAAALGALLALAAAQAPAVVLVAVSALAGGSMPQVGSMVRARWAHLLGRSGRLGTAFALESITDELTFTLAPVLLVAVSTGFSPVWALSAALVMVVAGTLAFAAVRAGAPEPMPVRVRAQHGVLRLRGVAVLAAAFVAIGTVFGSLQVGITSTTAALGQAGAAGPIYATFSGASLAGGLVYGVVRWRAEIAVRLLAAVALLSASTVALAFAGSVPLLYGAAALAGFVIAPAVITGYTLVERLVPAEVRTETFTWLNGATGLGIATGAAVAGQLVDRSGPALAFIVPPVTTGLAALLVFFFLSGLRPAADRSPDREPASAAV
ncbi:MFS transporter [Planomonospora venezuelensis]|uniref:MFS family permease n=1 Tax=Planomonospora venezuelensis TaxID=1999 RepID=A0A841DBB1_PLAVE|nr:MFS transporter [Planomonospora venezuelensis]MBB5965744.1 MFS family permease [Planomonospora venezuelensis]GIM62310.1 MFS transporter [Planomonospora venezuelensis]